MTKSATSSLSVETVFLKKERNVMMETQSPETDALLLALTNSVATVLCRETKRYDEDLTVALAVQFH